MTQADDQRLVGSDRVLAVLVELARRPEGVGLDEMARAVNSSKPTVHRALASLRRAGLAGQDAPGHYMLGDEFLRLAFANYEARPDYVRVEPVLRALAERFHETAHYAVLSGPSIVYRAKVDPSGGAMKLTSMVGGQNPAHSTGVGKLLLAYQLPDLAAVRSWVGERTLHARTARTATTAEDLHRRLRLVRKNGYSVDDRENEPDVNCIALPVFLQSPTVPSGAISISAIAHRTPLKTLVAELPTIRALIAGGGLGRQRRPVVAPR
ncbi:IclR family transcriptional regulator [Angustibacter sp. McL0619]|uniref:IclR family transcriptional regulator n=1 Tax=Angustibacter sp. McL0619 TaxID=3415676 RepID=UPI003CFA8CA9